MTDAQKTPAPNKGRPRPVFDEGTWRRFERALSRKEMFRYHAEGRISRNLKPQMLVRDDSVKGGWRAEVKVFN